MNLKKFAVVAAAACLVSSLALVGCSNNQSSDEGGVQVLNQGKLTVATSPDYPPFESLEGSEYVGLDMEIAKAVADDLGLEFNPVTIQFDGQLAAIEAGGQADIAISGITITPERAEQVNFSTSYYTDDQAIVAMTASGFTADTIDAALNSADIVIAVQSGTTGESYAKENYPQAQVVAYGNANDSFAALQAGQAQAVITNKAVADSMVKSYTDASVVKPIATGEEYGIAVSKDNPELLAAVNATIAKMQEDGTLEQLTVQYLG